MIINHSMTSIFANRQVGLNEKALQKTMEGLSSGMKINRAGDDSANLAVSEKMRAQIRGLNKASENVQNGVNFIQTAEGYLQETTDVLQRIRELAVQSSNGIYSEEDRMQIQVEVDQLINEIDRIASQAQFNGMNIFTGRFAKQDGQEMTFHIGANMDQRIATNIERMDANALGLKGEGQDGSDQAYISITDADEANRTLGVVDEALKNVNRQRADLGAVQNRMEMAKKGIDVASENLVASESTIRDQDMASAMVDYTKNNILTQSATAMLAQANSNAANVLSLLK